ncbi:hypothetical protein V6N13_133713 [Hibiscus sabdariffa]|uniref:Uncharacterized protein n=1 Tax=Hibiscus sabdariffa TaxID=183260 RepID=A0ABR2R0V2_9ROSI
MARKDRRETLWRRKRHQVSQSVSRPIDSENTTNPGSFTKGPIRKRVVGVVDENSAWSKHIFKNIDEVMGSLVYIDKDTSTPASFEQGCILIETDMMNRIEDAVKLAVNGRLYPVHVQEIDSSFQNEVDSDSNESVSEESA